MGCLIAAAREANQGAWWPGTESDHAGPTRQSVLKVTLVRNALGGNVRDLLDDK
jgi:hypothetical protein